LSVRGEPGRDIGRLTVKNAIRVAVFVALALVAGCKGPPPTKAKFNDGMVKANKDLSKAARDFRKALDPIKEGKAFNPSNVDTAISRSESLVKQLKEDYEDAQLPSNSGTAPQLLEDYQKFLAAEEKVIDKMKEIAKVAKDGNFTAQQRWAMMDVLFKDIEKLERVPLDAIKATQKKYSEEHNFRLVDRRD
jgi:hypothetical protein